MYSLGLLAVSSFVLALVLTPLVRNFARARGWVDDPGEERRVHSVAVPRIGGVAIAAAYLGAYGVLFASGLSASNLAREGLPLFWDLVPALSVVFAVGLVDDLWGLKAWQKLGGQVVAAGLVVAAGVCVRSVGGFELPVYVAVPVTVVWIVGCANAFNLIDGVDGLAAGVGLFATVTMVLAALLGDSVAMAMATVPLAGALLGFLRYNFNPATIFLGDCGSLTVGFVLGCIGALWSQKSSTVLGMTAPLMALTIPLLDTALAIVRRFLRMQPIWGADRGHIHHRLLDRGLTPRRAVLILYGMAGLGAAFSVLQSFTKNSYGGVVVILFCVVTWAGVQHLGYVEFGVAGRMFMDGAFRRHLNAQLTLRSLEEALGRAASAEECWTLISGASSEFGCQHVRMRLGGRVYGNGNGRSANSMQIHIPLNETDYVAIEKEYSNGARPDTVGAFANVVGRRMQGKVAELRLGGPEKARVAGA